MHSFQLSNTNYLLFEWYLVYGPTRWFFIGQAYRMSQFWLLGISWLLISLSFHLIFVHIVPYAVDKGISPVHASFILFAEYAKKRRSPWRISTYCTMLNRQPLLSLTWAHSLHHKMVCWLIPWRTIRLLPYSDPRKAISYLLSLAIFDVQKIDGCHTIDRGYGQRSHSPAARSHFHAVIPNTPQAIGCHSI